MGAASVGEQKVECRTCIAQDNVAHTCRSSEWDLMNRTIIAIELFEGKSWIERITPFRGFWIGSCKVSKRKYPIKRKKRVLTPYSPYSARIRPSRVREHTVSVRASNGYGQNVAKMPPARMYRTHTAPSIRLVQNTVLSPNAY